MVHPSEAKGVLSGKLQTPRSLTGIVFFPSLQGGGFDNYAEVVESPCSIFYNCRAYHSPLLTFYPATLQSSVIRQLWWMLVYFVLFCFYIHLFIVSVCVWACSCCGVCVEARGKLAGVSSLLLLCKSQALNSGH